MLYGVCHDKQGRHNVDGLRYSRAAQKSTDCLCKKYYFLALVGIFTTACCRFNIERGSMIVARVKKAWECETGSAMVYFALVLFILVGMAAIALDGSNAYIQRRRMVTAADAALRWASRHAAT